MTYQEAAPESISEKNSNPENFGLQPEEIPQWSPLKKQSYNYTYKGPQAVGFEFFEIFQMRLFSFQNTWMAASFFSNGNIFGHSALLQQSK